VLEIKPFELDLVASSLHQNQKSAK